MKQKSKTIPLLTYIILSLFYLEILFRFTVYRGFVTAGLVIPILFSMVLSLVLYFIGSLFKPKVNHILSCIFLAVLGFFFSSQFIYYDFFKTFYSMFSASNMTQILDFSKEIAIRVAQNIIWVILFFIPFLFLLIFGRKVFSFEKPELFFRGSLIILAVIVHFSAVGVIYLGGREQNSPYDLYYKNSYPVLSVERLGLITTTRLDLQRLLTGWTPGYEVANPYLPESPASESPEKTPVEQSDSEQDTPDGLPTDPPDDAEGEETEPPEIVYNILDIDFDELIINEKDQDIIEMHEYFRNVPPTPQNEYTGQYKGYNLILITAEGFSPYAVHEELTPTLYKMVEEGYKFTNFYVPIWDVSTSDGEYVSLTSLIPKSGVWSFYHSSKIDLPFVMGNQLKRLGYKTVAYHNHSYSYYRRDLSHPNMGYDYKGIGNGLVMKKQWPRSDLEMMEITIPEYIDSQPFHAYYMTVSGHLEYNFMGNAMALKNKKNVEDLPYSEPAKAYIATQIELDRAMEYLLAQLEEAGIADKTLIAMSSDHYPYGLEHHVIEELAGHKLDKHFDVHRNTFILYTKGIEEPIAIDAPGSSLDIIPTLSNLLGLEYDSRLLMGRDLFSDSEPLVIFRDRSFITDKGRYNAVAREFTPNPGVEVDDEYIQNMINIVNAKFYYSTMILDKDYYSHIPYPED
ncbi:MAG: sulfatase-like hydrolase/transferase [Clostridiales bacterium]|nr:sulfatase-like hydrolase/transferase [Clostridiales bacterium]